MCLKKCKVLSLKNIFLFFRASRNLAMTFQPPAQLFLALHHHLEYPHHLIIHHMLLCCRLLANCHCHCHRLLNHLSELKPLIFKHFHECGNIGWRGSGRCLLPTLCHLNAHFPFETSETSSSMFDGLASLPDMSVPS